MDGDISQATLLVLGFLIALGTLIFTMDWLEESIDAPPSRLRRRLLGLVRAWTSRLSQHNGPDRRALSEEAATAGGPRLPLQRESPENAGALPTSVDDVGDDQAGDVDQSDRRTSPQ